MKHLNQHKTLLYRNKHHRHKNAHLLLMLRSNNRL